MLGLFLACQNSGDSSPIPPCNELELRAPRRDANIVLIINDTMRRDRSEIYGGPVRTPALASLAREGLVFTSASGEANWTRPAMATLFTSLYPSQHRLGKSLHVGTGTRREQVVAGSKFDVLSPQFETLPEVLRSTGRRTAGFVSNPWLASNLGFGQGFEHYDDSYFRLAHEPEPLTDRALQWLDSLEPTERFFLYVHYMSSHRPYGQLEPELIERERSSIEADDRPLPTEAQNLLLDILQLTDGRLVIDSGVRPTLRLIEMAYDRGVENFDASLGRLLAGLRAHPAFAETAVIVAGDHGEALFTRGYGDHGKGLFDDETALPLVARLPGVSPASGRIDCPVGLIDLLPSLCDYVGATCPGDAQGLSLFAGPEADGRYLVSESAVNGKTHRAIRNRSFKLIHEPEGPPVPDDETRVPPAQPYSLFDRKEDPDEARNLTPSNEVSASTYAVLEVMVPALHAAVPEFTAPRTDYRTLSDEMRERLRALGYTD